MSRKSIFSGSLWKLSKQSLKPYRLALIGTWLLAVIVLVVMLVHGVRNSASFLVGRHILQVGYVAALLWYLCRTGPSVEHMSDFQPFLSQRRRIVRWIPALGIALLFAWTVLVDASTVTLLLLMMVSTIGILLVWCRKIRCLPLILGLGLAAGAFLGGLPFWTNDFVGKSIFILLLAFTPPMFVAGGLLSKRTGLMGSRLVSGQYGKALQGFLWGCLLFVPLGLFNAASGSPGTGITWVSEGWMPLTLPWYSGIVEEAWFRLFLVSLCYFLLRPAFGERSVLALTCAVLFSAITFGLGHNGTLLDRVLVTGLLYGLPMAVVFVRRDWEHAVGAHYMINMIPWMMVFLKA